MTGERDPGGRDKKDPILHFGSIPGTGDTTLESTEVSKGPDHPGSAYEQVRGLLTEPVPSVGAGKLSERMAKEMESFDRRWSERPIPTLVSAGKRMVDQSDSTGLNRLLGLSVPTTDLDCDQAAPDETVEPEASDTDTVEDDTADQDDVGDPELTALSGATESEAEIVPLGEVDGTQPREHAAGALGPQEPVSDSREDRMRTAAPTAGMIAAQTAYMALNPLEAEIFRTQMGLMDATQVRDVSIRSQELALETVHRYELETIDLQQQLEAMREKAASAEQAAATLNESLAGKVAALEGQLELLTAERIAARSEGADGDDDSGGGAGRELVRGHDDLRPEEEAQPAEAADRSDGDDAAADLTHLEEASGSELYGDEPVADTDTQRKSGDEGDGGIAQMLQLLARGEDTPVLGQETVAEEGVIR